MFENQKIERKAERKAQNNTQINLLHADPGSKIAG